jgi:hypothetical protein
VPMYTCALCLYYHCKLKNNMTDEAFTLKVERKLHVGIIAWNLIACTFLLVAKTLNPMAVGTVCHISSFPPGCRLFPETYGECTRGQNDVFYYLTFVFGVYCLVIMVLVVIMSMLCWHVIGREKFRVRRGNTAAASEQEQEILSLSRIYRREMVLQAAFYSGVFLGVYSLAFVNGFIVLAGSYSNNPAFAIAYFTLFPLGGFFNILIYARPSVVTLHRRYSEYSWLRALWLVLKAGGEVPDEPSQSELLTSSQPSLLASSQVRHDFENNDIVLSLRAPKLNGCENGASDSFGAHRVGCRTEQDGSYEKDEGSMLAMKNEDYRDEEEDSAEMTFSQLGLSAPTSTEVLHQYSK